MPKKIRFVFLFIIFGLTVDDARAVTLEELDAKVNDMAAENKELKEKVRLLESRPSGSSSSNASGLVQLNHQFSYDMLDATTRINRKELYILQKKQSGELTSDSVILGGAVTSMADYQKSNLDHKFSYLMRQPTVSNQVGREVSEAVVHSAQIGLTAAIGEWVAAQMDVLYEPEQSFGAGTNTALARNLLQMRRAYVLLGNLEKSPFYASIGKSATPFGLTDTVNPFTASTVWHAFGGLANGVTLGFLKNGLRLSFMGVEGGAQFRSNNTSVAGTAVPSRLDNFSADANYTHEFDKKTSLLVGTSYQRGSAYCQDFPITHFAACKDNNAAFDVYSQLGLTDLTLQAEIAQTENVWPGTFNPAIPQFAASRVTSFGAGGKYRMSLAKKPLDLSGEFSRFVAGPNGAPWEFQDQWVWGLASFIEPSVKLFAEYIHIAGYAPLNFISGGNVPTGQTHSDDSGRNDLYVVGVNAAF
ncbi:MAG: hypothetical protein HYT79_07325 [Elusimicrobia bacterium]|nr:hypothetical protein [Elusimicrobiota bacterium]